MVLQDCEPKDADTILRAILRELSVHSAGCLQTDELTAVVIQVQAFEQKKSLAPLSQSASSSAGSRFGKVNVELAKWLTLLTQNVLALTLLLGGKNAIVGRSQWTAVPAILAWQDTES